jgi:hypothetical protein
MVSPYKPGIGGPIRAHRRPYEFTIDPWIRIPHWLCSQAMYHSHMFTYRHPILPPLTLNLKNKVLPQKVVIRMSLGVNQAPLLPPKSRPIIRTRVLTSLMNGAPKLVPEPFQVPLCNRNLPPLFTRRESPSPWINTSGGAWQR